MGGFKIGEEEVYRCEDCGFEFKEDHLNFFLNLKTGQIEDFMILMRTVRKDRNSPLRGYITKSYCNACEKYICTYHINSVDKNYDIEAAYYLLRLLLPKKIDFAYEKLNKYNNFEKIIKSKDLEKINDFIGFNKIYLDEIDTIDSIGDIEYMDLDYYKENLMNELEDLKNIIYCIHLPDENYYVNLNGEKLERNHCPNCKNAVYEFNYDCTCPKCGAILNCSICMVD